jgi:hypothetical protein
MNTILSRFVLAALATTGFGSAVEVATTPVGYVSQTLQANAFNSIGLTLHKSPLVSSQLTEVTANSVSSSLLDFTSLLTPGSTYILEITSGTGVGTIQEVTSWDGDTLSLPQNLTLVGVVIGDSFKIRKAPTLEEVFGTTVTVLAKGFNAGAADIVWVPDGNAGYTRYFLHASNAWRNAANSAASPNIPLVYTDGILIEKGSASASLVISGELKKEGTNAVIVKGFNLISVVAPVGSTLQNLGLEDDLASGFNAGAADIVWVPVSAGQYARYFRHNTAGWRSADTNVNVTVDVPLPSAILIERGGASKNISLKTPNYSF